MEFSKKEWDRMNKERSEARYVNKERDREKDGIPHFLKARARENFK